MSIHVAVIFNMNKYNDYDMTVVNTVPEHFVEGNTQQRALNAQAHLVLIITRKSRFCSLSPLYRGNRALKIWDTCFLVAKFKAESVTSHLYH